jgi:glycosyltransferase involved in cell wall biosynthesis
MSAPPRVLQFATGELFGGAERQIITLSRALRVLGVDVRALLFFDRELAAALRAIEVPVEILNPRSTFDTAVPGKIRVALEATAPAVIHVHGYRPCVMLAMAGGTGAARVVKTEHGLPEFSTSLFENLRARTYRALENFAARRLRAQIVYVTEELRQRCAAEHGGLTGTVIYNGVDLQALTPGARPAEFASGQINLICIGRLDHVKGFDVAVEAIARLPESLRVHLHLLGDGPERPRLTELARAAKGRVSLLGFGSKPYPYIAHADAMVIPSRHEGLPFVLLEAWGLGTPVVASDVGGLREVIRGGETGLLVPSGDVSTLADTLRRVSEDEALRQRLASAAGADVRSRFDGAAMASAYLRQYVSLAQA